jgi:hypothetical protein
VFSVGPRYYLRQASPFWVEVVISKEQRSTSRLASSEETRWYARRAIPMEDGLQAEDRLRHIKPSFIGIQAVLEPICLDGSSS